MAAMMCRSVRKQQGVPAWYVCATAAAGTDDDAETKQEVPKGYIPMVLVGDGDDGSGLHQGQRIMVHVRMLREPCMAALLDMAEQQFGLNQRGVLRVPCSVVHFQHMLEAAT